MECICEKHHPVTAFRSNGQPLSEWRCPQHGNVFEDRASPITLTSFQLEVLRVVSDEHQAGRPTSAEAISWIVNRTVNSVERVLVFLRSTNFIEPTVTGERK